MLVPRMMSTEPRSHSSGPAMRRRMVVLPAPFGPTSPMRERGLMPQSIPFRTSWTPYDRVTPLSRIIRPVYTPGGVRFNVRGDRGSGEKDDLAGGARLHDRLVGAPRLGERQLARDDRPQRAALETGLERGMQRPGLGLRGVPEAHRQNRRIAPHAIARIDLDPAAAADDDDAPARRQGLEIDPEIDVRQHLE